MKIPLFSGGKLAKNPSRTPMRRAADGALEIGLEIGCEISGDMVKWCR